MTLKASVDDASSWLEDKWLLYDERGCWGVLLPGARG